MEFLNFVCTIFLPLLMLFNIELSFSGGGGGDKLVFGVRGNLRLSPLNETLGCMDSPVFFFGWLTRLQPGYT